MISMVSPKKSVQFELRWALNSVISALEVIINDYKTMQGNLEILFLSWVLSNNVFSHEKQFEVQFCLKHPVQVPRWQSNFSPEIKLNSNNL